VRAGDRFLRQEIAAQVQRHAAHRQVGFGHRGHLHVGIGLLALGMHDVAAPVENQRTDQVEGGAGTLERLDGLDFEILPVVELMPIEGDRNRRVFL